MKILDVILHEAYGVVPGDPIGDAIKQAQQKKAQPKLQSKPEPISKSQPQTKPSTVQPQPVTGSPLENTLRSLAIKAGILGQELAQFLAQCAHETANFSTLTEFGDSKTFSRYDPKFNPSKAKELGNVMPGDGERFKGRGFIQITGRYNYTQAGEALGLPLDKNPQLLENPNVAAQASIWFWKNKVKPKISNFTDTKAVTSVINPALRGLQQRHRAFQDYIKTTLTSKQSVKEENIKLVAKHYFPVDDEEIIIRYKMKKDHHGYYLPQWNTSGRVFDAHFTSLNRLYGRPHTLKENFADGKVKGKSRPGRVKRAGASCSGSVTSLRQRAKNASGEKAKMYHWCANMKSGKKK